MRKETGGRNAAVVETATQLRQRLARYQPPTTDVNSYHHPPLRCPTMPAFTHPRATPCARRHSPTVASSSSAGLIVRMVGRWRSRDGISITTADIVIDDFCVILPIRCHAPLFLCYRAIRVVRWVKAHM